MNAHEKDLPELPDDAVERIEAGVFADISRERASARTSRSHRRRWVGGGLSAAAVVVVAIAVTPMMLDGSGGADMATPEDASDESASGGSASSGQSEDAAAITAAEVPTDRRVIRNGNATLVVDDILQATKDLTKLASEYDGYVEQLGTSTDGEDEATEGWMTLRLPAEHLDGARSSLEDIGDIARIEISEDDVTAQAIDLEARVDSLTSSVARLKGLMEKAGSVGELLKAETALSERQAQLESYQRELDHLDKQVAMSTLEVHLTRDREAASTDPAGFGDGLLTGWNGLIAFFNGLVVAFGFLLPWIAVVGAVTLAVWFVVRLVRRRSRSRT